MFEAVFCLFIYFNILLYYIILSCFFQNTYIIYLKQTCCEQLSDKSLTINRLRNRNKDLLVLVIYGDDAF